MEHIYLARDSTSITFENDKKDERAGVGMGKQNSRLTGYNTSTTAEGRYFDAHKPHMAGNGQHRNPG
jgi:hypothetical protein